MKRHEQKFKFVVDPIQRVQAPVIPVCTARCRWGRDERQPADLPAQHRVQGRYPYPRVEHPD